MWGKVTLWQGFSFGVLQFHPVSIIPLLSHTDLCVCDRRHMILPFDSVVEYIYQRHHIRFGSRAALRPRETLDQLPFWCHYSTTYSFRRYIRGHRRGDLVSNKTVTRSRTDDLERWRQQLDNEDNRTLNMEGDKLVCTISESPATGMLGGPTLQVC